MESCLTTYRKKKKERADIPKDTSPFAIHHWGVIQKCYVDEGVLQRNDAYVVKLKFNDADGVSRTLIMASLTTHFLQMSQNCIMKTFQLVGL